MPESVSANLGPGFQDPVAQSQQTFRAVLKAMAEPGLVVLLIGPEGPGPMHDSAVSVLLTLADTDTPLWLDRAADTPEVREYLRFHCGCPITRREDKAVFALLVEGDILPDLNRFSMGTPEYPDRSATLVIQVDALETINERGVTFTPGHRVTLTGPGIPGERGLLVRGLDPEFWIGFAELSLLFPLGLDVILAAPGMAACLPRSVRVKECSPCM